MPMKGDLTVAVRHWAPVRLRLRAGIPERIGFDPMTTPVRIRHVDPAAFEDRDLPTETYQDRPPKSLRVQAFEGRLWRRMSRPTSNGAHDPASIDQALMRLTGAGGIPWSPFRPVLPQHHLLAAYEGGVRIPDRTLARAALCLHEASVARVVHVALNDLVHDGTSVFVAMDNPLIHFGLRSRTASVGWRDRTDGWDPMFRHDRPGEAAIVRRALERDGRGTGQDFHAKAVLSKGLVEAMRGITPVDDDLRHFFLKGCFAAADALASCAWFPGADRTAVALGELCARSTIHVTDEDPVRAAGILRDAARACIEALPGNRGAGADDQGLAMRRMDVYVAEVVEPRLAGRVPDEDIDSLDALAP